MLARHSSFMDVVGARGAQVGDNGFAFLFPSNTLFVVRTSRKWEFPGNIQAATQRARTTPRWPGNMHIRLAVNEYMDVMQAIALKRGLRKESNPLFVLVNSKKAVQTNHVALHCHEGTQRKKTHAATEHPFGALPQEPVSLLGWPVLPSRARCIAVLTASGVERTLSIHSEKASFGTTT